MNDEVDQSINDQLININCCQCIVTEVWQKNISWKITWIIRDCTNFIESVLIGLWSKRSTSIKCWITSRSHAEPHLRRIGLHKIITHTSKTVRLLPIASKAGFLTVVQNTMIMKIVLWQNNKTTKFSIRISNDYFFISWTTESPIIRCIVLVGPVLVRLHSARLQVSLGLSFCIVYFNNVPPYGLCRTKI